MNTAPKNDGSAASWLNVVQTQVESLRFGVVQIVVHDSRVVQIERTEKVRLDKAESRPEPVAHSSQARPVARPAVESASPLNP
jgi:hypothetical protein